MDIIVSWSFKYSHSIEELNLCVFLPFICFLTLLQITQSLNNQSLLYNEKLLFQLSYSLIKKLDNYYLNIIFLFLYKEFSAITISSFHILFVKETTPNTFFTWVHRNSIEILTMES